MKGNPQLFIGPKFIATWKTIKEMDKQALAKIFEDAGIYYETEEQQKEYKAK